MEERCSRMGIKINQFETKQKEIPEEFKDLAKNFAEKGISVANN